MKKIILLIFCFALLFGKNSDIENLQNECTKKREMACVTLGNLYENGKGVEQDYKKANELYMASCNSGIGIGCYSAGNLYENGKGIRQDITKANELFMTS